jgi:hypothetical protein
MSFTSPESSTPGGSDRMESLPQIPQMSSASLEPTTGRSKTLMIAAWAGGAILVILVIIGLTLRMVTPTKPPTPPSEPGDNPLVEARTTLAKQTDLASCGAALQQFNQHLSQADNEHRVRALSTEERKQLKQFALDKGEQAEVEGSSFTPLDAHYLDLCFLMRDVAQLLDVKATLGKSGKTLQLSPLQRAAAGFAWVVRQVRLEEREGEILPPQVVVRRGWGSALERAVVFLTLLQEFGVEDNTPPLQGCLVYCPGPRGERLWACGVAVGNKPDVLYLFDPRLGLPLPGPKGQGIATLAQAAADGKVLAQLDATEKLRYDVTAEQAKSARLELYCPLSALAPRMELLQTRLLRDRRWKDQPLPVSISVRLTVNVSQALERLQMALARSGDKEEVRVWRAGTGLLRNFLPPEDGGTDKGIPVSLRERLPGFTTEDDPTRANLPRKNLVQMELVPWVYYPPEFRDPTFFRYDYGLGQRLRALYSGPFIRAYTEPDQPRDLILHGRFHKAAQLLTAERQQREQERARRLGAENLGQELQKWLQEATSVYAAEARAKGGSPEAVAEAQRQMSNLWKKSQPIGILLQGALANPGLGEALFQLGQCRHEQAEQLQARLNLIVGAKGKPDPAEVARVREAWDDASSWWEDYRQHAKGQADTIKATAAAAPNSPLVVTAARQLQARLAAARQMHARAQAMRDDWKAAVQAARDQSDLLAELEKLARLPESLILLEKLANLYQVRELEKARR